MLDSHQLPRAATRTGRYEEFQPPSTRVSSKTYPRLMWTLPFALSIDNITFGPADGALVLASAALLMWG